MEYVHSKYCRKRDHQCGDDVVNVKTGTKPFTQNAYFANFLEGHLLESRFSQKRVRYLESHLNYCKFNFEKICLKTLWRDGSLPIPLHLMFSNEKSNVTLCDWISVLCIKLCIYIMLFCF